ncbi:hypothetical protein EUGRSUZ_C02123 [Eucalyptus grandis]|uniref:Uncharacterized protein n=2 Tax=Eucalyptus grandis TaxID=71139 RepID=A0ACC3LF82_EUCGR|nr:hypothetical protein EUGRSUZ_C02123 [Eucalyptus grandis]
MAVAFAEICNPHPDLRRSKNKICRFSASLVKDCRAIRSPRLARNLQRGWMKICKSWVCVLQLCFDFAKPMLLFCENSVKILKFKSSQFTGMHLRCLVKN